ncbi:MAG: nucleoside deaminase [Deltaproteobacteria bacterium]|nr:nucleoside deaminase [Deltaproteobacteria bacterium]
MSLALREAQKAAGKGEVPVGVVVVGADGKILARAHNLRETTGDPTAHAEVLALRKSAAKQRSWRLTGCTVYVSMEPCPMCAGALVNARVSRLVFGCADPKAGACGTLFDVPQDRRLNHRVEVTSGVMREECSSILKAFFRKQRKKRPLVSAGRSPES